MIDAKEIVDFILASDLDSSEQEGSIDAKVI